jgi:hypothetical protein
MTKPSTSQEPTVVEVHGGALLRKNGRVRVRVGSSSSELSASGALALPLAAQGADVVFISQTLEHLEIGRATELLLEARRVLSNDGRLLLDLPDFEAALARWVRGEENREDATEGSDRLETLDQRAAALFCTYRRLDDSAYVGPPRVASEVLRAMARRLSPADLSIALCHLVIDTETRFRFERQNAWSRSELTELLRRVGFDTETLDDAREASLAAALPGVDVRRAGRLTCVAKPAPQQFREAVRLATLGEHDLALEALRAAVTQEPELARAHYRFLWDLYTRLVKERAPRDASASMSPSFAEQGYHLGHLRAADVERARSALIAAPTVLVKASDYDAGYMFNADLSPEGEDAVNRDNTYFAFTPEVLASTQPILDALVEPVRSCLGTPWRLVNLRSWRTPSNAGAVESNGWHRDAPYPPMVLKIMVYLSEASPETGTTEVVQPDGSRTIALGPAGTFMVFKNFELTHRGVPPMRGERLVLEVTVAPHTEDVQRPVHAGQNADFPLSPWTFVEAR